MYYVASIVEPKFQLAYTGNKVYITCDTKMEKYWIKDWRDRVSSEDLLFDNILIKEVQESDAGIYACVVDKRVKGSSKLVVGSKPNILV